MAGSVQVNRNLQGRSAALWPVQGAGGASVRERWSRVHARHAEHCKWDVAAKDLPTHSMVSRNGQLGVQQLVMRKGNDACHAVVLSRFDLNTN